MEIEKTLRRRVNVSILTKGIRTWDCTVDSNYLTLEETLTESDELVKELDKRYPVLEEK